MPVLCYVAPVRRFALVPLAAALLVAAVDTPAQAQSWHYGRSLPGHEFFQPGNLLVATSDYNANPNVITPGVSQLPPGCAPANCGTAVSDGTYPYVFNNDTADGSFGITSPIVLDQLTPSGQLVDALEVPNSSLWPAATEQMVTSFSSKSELALNLSTSGQYVTLMGYNAPDGTLDVSNSSTPGVVDPTNPTTNYYYRVVAELNAGGRVRFTETNAFSGDNGRAAILNDEGGADLFYATGNAGNGSNPEPNGVVLGAGAQVIQPSSLPEADQIPAQPTPVGSFNINQLGAAVDKSAKDDNFRGMTVYNNVLYYAKGSGSNGVDTVYFVDTTGKACPTGGVGVPVPGVSLPTTSNFTVTDLPAKKTDPGLTPENMCILKGFPTLLATNATDTSDYPFGLWFANPDTLYVADEGAGDNTNTTFSSTSNGIYSAAAASTTAGLQKWIFNQTAGNWQLAYTLQNGLNLGMPYTVPGYPTGLNSTASGGTGLPWAPATAGLRNLTGRVNPDGTATIWAETSTVSGSGDQGADPNELAEITDQLDATSLPASESFAVVLPPVSGQVVRGVSFTPVTSPSCLLGQGPDSQSGQGSPGGQDGYRQSGGNNCGQGAPRRGNGGGQGGW